MSWSRHLFVEVEEAMGAVYVVKVRHADDAVVNAHGVAPELSLARQDEPVRVRSGNKHLQESADNFNYINLYTCN